MKRITLLIIAATLILPAVSLADLFRNIQTGETFYGYPLQKRMGNKARAYVLQENEKFKAISFDTTEYEITYDQKGRRDNIIFIPINNQEILLSQNVSQTLSKTIILAANKGPRYIVIELDNPGGRGENMKTICDSIVDTANCPVIAYIPGGTFGGAYSATAMIAMACDKVYMAPNTLMATVSSPAGAVLTNEQSQQYQQTFTSDTLASYSSYAATLAQKNERPALLAVAMINKNVDIIEVQIDEKGKTQFIDRSQKTPSMKLIRNLSVGERTVSTVSAIPALSPEYGQDDANDRSAAATGAKQLILTAEQAVSTGMADRIVNSRTELIAALGAESAKIVRNKLMQREVQKFLVSKDNMINLLTNIEFLNNRAQQLDAQFTEIQQQNIRGTVRRETFSAQRPNVPTNRGTARNVWPDNYRYSRRNINNNVRIGYYGMDALGRDQRDDDIFVESEQIMADQVGNELLAVIDDLIANYNKAIVLTRRYPGALPIDLNIATLQKDLNLVARKRDSLFY